MPGRMLTFLKIIRHFEAKIPRICRIGHSSFEIDNARADEPVNLAVEVLHAFGAAIAHGIEKRFAVAFTLFHVFPRTHSGLEYFHCGDAPLAVLLRKKALGDDVAEGFGEPSANSLLVGHRENSNDALDCFRCINGMQRGHDEVARFGSFEGDLDGFPVAHFADENDFWRLSTRCAQSQRKSWRV